MIALFGALDKLAKWRSVFAGWQLGTRSDTDPECQAVRDHRELSMLMRAELTALFGVLIHKGIVTIEELQLEVADEAAALDKAYEKKFPGFKSTPDGMSVDVEVARETMKGWRP